MRAAVAIFDGPGRPTRFEERAGPTLLEPGEVIVQISLATICGSDLHTVAGRRLEPTPCVLGHEGVGHVVAAGAGRERWLGMRVTWTLASSCGVCVACKQWQLPQKCAQVKKYGHLPLAEGHGLHGTYATHIVLQAGTHLVEVPSHLPDAVAASANCALATAVHATDALPMRCEVAVVQGAGLLGLYACALLRDAGVPRVLVVDVDAGRLQSVAQVGGVAVPHGDDLPQRDADLVIEATGSAAAFPQGLAMLRPGGRYALTGLVHPQSQLAITGERLIRSCLTLQGIHNYAPWHLDRAVAFLDATRVPSWAALVSPPLPLRRLDDAFELARSQRWPRVAVAPSH